MAYRKSIKGDHNEASEQLSHNRITVEAGSAGVLFVAFLIALITSAIIWLVVHYGGLLLVSLLALWLVAVVGGIWLLGVYIYSKTGILLSERRQARNRENWLSAPADHHSIYLQDLQPRYSIHEVSANVVAAGVPRVLPAPADEPPLETNEQDIVDMYNDGQVTLEEICRAFNLKYHKVQSIVASAKKRGLINRK